MRPTMHLHIDMKDSVKVVVLMGGPSQEHAISLKSGRGVAEALIRRGWRVEAMVVPESLAVEEACAFTAHALQRAGADVVFIALHGRFGEDGTVQQVCEGLHLAYTGSGPEASRLGMDKVASRRRFERAGLAVPRWCVVDTMDSSGLSALEGWSHHLLVTSAKRKSADEIGRRPRRGRPQEVVGWSYPLVVKPSDQGSSLGVSLVREPQALAEALTTARAFGRCVLIEEFVAGRELTVGVVGDRALPVVEIRAHQPFFDYTAKYTPGMTDYLVPAPLAPSLERAVQAAGLAAHHALGCRHFSRADMILAPDGVPVVLELNTIPGFTPTSLLPKAASCAGFSYDALCEQLVLMTAHDLLQVAG